jgi:hypothetical protein
MVLEKGLVAINPVFDKLMTGLAEENISDNEATSYDNTGN